MHFLVVSLPSFMMCCDANSASLLNQKIKLFIWQTTRAHVLCQPCGELESSSDGDLELTKYVLKLLFGETGNSSSQANGGSVNSSLQTRGGFSNSSSQTDLHSGNSSSQTDVGSANSSSRFRELEFTNWSSFCELEFVNSP